MGHLWLWLSLLFPDTTGFGICLFKHVTGIPCPSCGITRSISLVFSGRFADALQMNPLGLIAAPVLIGLPIWLLTDAFRKKHTFFHYYVSAENILKRPYVAIPLVILIAANWAWNISKGL